MYFVHLCLNVEYFVGLLKIPKGCTNTGHLFSPLDAAHPVTLLFTQPLKLLGRLPELLYTPCIFLLQLRHRPLVVTVLFAQVLLQGIIGLL